MTVRHSRGEYEVKFTRWSALADQLPVQAAIITDSNVAGFLPQEIEPTLVVPAGEASKSWEVAGQLLDALVEIGHHRGRTVVAIGGGVVGDLAGFVAGVLLRGVPFLQVPTSLLAMVDSSVGGKVGVDLPSGKNLAGVFLPPQEVLLPIDALDTLPPAEFRNGMAEVIKYALIGDPDLAAQLESHPLLEASDPRVADIVERCIAQKARVVAEDEFETTGLRATLNCGHTIGHALEHWGNYTRFRHGEAVAIGMVVETRIAENLGLAPEGLSQRVAGLVEKHGLPTEPPAEATFEALLPIMARDKKATGTGLAFSLLEGVGACKLVTNVEPSAVADVLHRR